MAENPLLPHAELKALYRLLAIASAAAPSSVHSQPRPRKKTATAPAKGCEALWAGTLLQLQDADLVVPTPSMDTSVAALLRTLPPAKALTPNLQAFPARHVPLLRAAGLAAAARRAGTQGLVLAFLETETESQQWVQALQWAQEDSLPLILVCADRSGAKAFRPAPPEAKGLSWDLVQPAASKLKLPILSVDGQDAVAVYRVMQESSLRARSGAGPAILWAVLPEASSARRSPGSPSDTPLQRLQHYMAARKVRLPSIR